ncbi:MAG: hypothetical protein RBS80_15285 [Thermoguttaceae bacterium]|jgi:hypothetical protein|nr:hypothetical protein [Thermoguttaceae bacterium]
MTTVDEIVSAAGQLPPDEFILLRGELDRLEERLWNTELTEASERMERAGVTDDDIDAMVARRRHEGRA